MMTMIMMMIRYQVSLSIHPFFRSLRIKFDLSNKMFTGKCVVFVHFSIKSISI